MQRDGKRKWFVMEPPAVPDAANAPTEQTPTFDVYAVLRDNLKYVSLIHQELRLARQARHTDKQEMEMKVSELTSKVDELISVATDLKGRVDAGSSSSGTGSPVMSAPQEDDPEVERLAHRIEDAIAVLKGSATTAPVSPSEPPVTQPPANQFDPNSPAPEQPSDAALATDINSPQARDPNSPL